jgi:hypothetical protein
MFQLFSYAAGSWLFRSQIARCILDLFSSTTTMLTTTDLNPDAYRGINNLYFNIHHFCLQ